MFPVHANGGMNGTTVGIETDELFKQRYPVHRACRDGDLNALSLLLQQQGGGMNNHFDQSAMEIFKEDEQYGWTPAHWAAYFGKMECLQKLVETNRQMTLDRPTSRFLQTPAHTAAFGRQHICLQWLLQSGSQSDKQDCMGETPLHKAARTGSLECLSVLTAHGANIQIMNNSGLIASRLALQCGHTAASQYLKQMETQIGWFNGTHPHENGDSNINPNPAFINEGLNGGHLPSIHGMNGILPHTNGLTSLNGLRCTPVNGYTNGHGPITSQTNGHTPTDMETDNTGMERHNNILSGRPNGHISNGYSSVPFTNGFVPVTLGRKRSSDAMSHADDVKRMKTFEDSNGQQLCPFYANGGSPKHGALSSSVIEHQASIHMEHCYSLYAYNTLVAEMHGS